MPDKRKQIQKKENVVYQDTIRTLNEDKINIGLSVNEIKERGQNNF